MSDNFWADFVRWVASERDVRMPPGRAATHGASFVSSVEGARCVLAATYHMCEIRFAEHLDAFAAATGRTPPAETRSVDVPPTGGKEALLRLAERIRLAKVAAVERHVSKWSGEDERRAGQVSAFVECEEMVRGLAEEL